MKILGIALVACAALAAHAQTLWFTVMGNPDTPGVDTIMVDPVPVEVGETGKVMRVRVNRAMERKNWEGTPYRSYTALVKFNCNTANAQYQSAVFFMAPLWKGESHKTMDYTKGPVRPMLFVDVEPNPTARIVRAACNRE